MRYPLRATIIDIRSDMPRASDRLLLDTNVCLWLSWSRASEGHSAAKPYQLQQYPLYIRRALQAQSHLHHSALSYAEIAHHIERTEYHLTSQRHRSLSRKDFRQHADRDRVIHEIRTVWNVIRRLTTPIPTSMDPSAIHTVHELLQTYPLGPFDLFLVHALRQAGLDGIVTDDADFAFLPNLTVFTANLAVITHAREIGRLYSRLPLPTVTLPSTEACAPPSSHTSPR